MHIKMIVADLDNTLLRNDKTIGDYTVDVLKRVRERGMLIAFATARDFRFVTEHISPMSGIVPDVLIADNGALARYAGKDLYRRLIPVETVNALMPHFELVRCISTEKAYYLSGDYSNDHWSIGKKETVLTDFSDVFSEDALYIDGNVGDIQDFKLTYPGIRAVIYSDVSLVTVVHNEATKYNALIAVREALNIDANEIVVFGDDYSDIEILANHKYSVAVANAIDECKTVAGYTCGSSDEDGVAYWIEENLLK